MSREDYRITIHKLLLNMEIPWDVARIIKQFICKPPEEVHIRLDYEEKEIERLIKWRSRHKKRAFTI